MVSLMTQSIMWGQDKNYFTQASVYSRFPLFEQWNSLFDYLKKNRIALYSASSCPKTRAQCRTPLKKQKRDGRRKDTTLLTHLLSRYNKAGDLWNIIPSCYWSWKAVVKTLLLAHIYASILVECDIWRFRAEGYIRVDMGQKQGFYNGLPRSMLRLY